MATALAQSDLNTSLTAANHQSARKDTKRTIIDISVLNEAELLSMINGHINSMTNFVNKTRNVHNELKDTIANMGILLNRYMKIKNSTPKGKKIKSTSTQTEGIPTDDTQPEKNQCKKVKTADISTDTPCWLPTVSERESGSVKNQLHKQQPKQNGEHHENGEEFILVNRKINTMKQEEIKTPKENTEAEKPRRLQPMRKQAVIIDRSKGNITYADMVREVKKMILDKNLTFEITTRKAKSGNFILEIPSKEQADSLAELLKWKLGETTSIRRPSPTVLLFLME